MDAFSIWGAHWLGDASLWGVLSNEMATRWERGGAVLSAEQPSLAALAGLFASQPPPPAMALFYGLDQEEPVPFQPGAPWPSRALLDCSAPCLAALRYGLAGPYIWTAPGVVGGLALIAWAVGSLSPALRRVACVAGEMQSGPPPAVAVLGLSREPKADLESLGPLELELYDGPPDSGTQTDFLEALARRAQGHAGASSAAVVLNQPPEVKWQASLDAAARRAAPKARRYMLPVDGAGQAGGLMLILAALRLETPRPQSPRLVLAADQAGRAAALMVVPV
jgi:hypothetical protein